MHLEEIRRQRSPFSLYNLIIIFSFLAILTWSWKSTEISVKALLDGWWNMIVYVRGNPELAGSGFFPPAFNAYSLHKYLLSMVETVQMAFLALILSVVISFPLSFFASRNTLEIILPGKKLRVRILRKLLY